MIRPEMLGLPVRPSGVHSIVYEASGIEDQRYIDILTESEAKQVNASLVQNLYASVLDRNKADFGDIPASKGDIDKVEYIKTSEACLDILQEIQDKNITINIPELADIRKCIANIRSFKTSFEEAFKIECDMLIMMYNTMTMACIDATSCLIATHIDMITGTTIDPRLNRKSDKSRGVTSIDSIKKFNDAHLKGKLAGAVAFFLDDTRKALVGTEVVVTGVIIAGLLTIIPIMREMVFFYYNSRVKIHDYLQIQSDLLEMNKLALEASKRPEKEKKAIIKKQQKVIDKMRKSADKIQINNVDTNDVVKKEIKTDNSMFSLGNIQNTMSNNAFNGMGGIKLI